MDYTFFIHPTVNGHLAYFPDVNSATVNFEVHVYFRVMVLSRRMPRSGIARSCGSSLFSSIFRTGKDLQTVLYNGCTNLQPSSSVGGFLFLYTLFSIYCLYI